jgi:acetyl esterase/lipase
MAILPPRRPARLTLGATILLCSCTPLPVGERARAPVAWDELAALPVPAPDHRIPYGDDPLQFGELRLPDGPGPHPVAVIVHGGCWRAAYDLRHASHMAAALASAGVATWSLEYRRIGNEGGGWPGTLTDVARGTDHLRGLAGPHGLDLDRVVVVGHSAGGHLALWLAGRGNLPPDSPLRAAAPLPLRGVVALAAISDLRAYAGGSGSCNAAVAEFLGGMPEVVPERYALADPGDLLPLGVPVRLLHGALDPIVPPEQSRAFAERSRARGDDAEAWPIDGAGHFDVVAPHAAAWASVERSVRALLEEGR